jgi:hypothetical protein
MRIMLPDFPRIKKRFQREIVQFIKAEVQGEPFIALMKREIHHEGSNTDQSDVHGNQRKGDYQTIAATVSYDFNEIIRGGRAFFVKKALETAEEFKKQTVQMMMKTVDEVTKSTGQVVDGMGQPFTFDTYLKAIETVEMEFDAQGKSKTTFVTSPEMGRKIIELMREWEKDPEKKAQLEAAFNKKREEWRVRESTRELVD